jgi:hypothetical protein
VNTLFSQHGNKWANPRLKIQQAANIPKLRAQRDDVFPAASFNDPEALKTFTGTARMRSRASILSPQSAGLVQGGMAIPAGGGSVVDGAWNGGSLTEDIFGVTVNPASPPFGAAAGPYNQ